MNINKLINASQVIGRGLAQQACQIELTRIGGDGVFWQRRNAPSGSGLWCSKQDWQLWVTAVTGVTSSAEIACDLLPCVSAAAFDVAGEWLVDCLEEVPKPFGLVPDIYPVLTLQTTQLEQGDVESATQLACVLVDWPQEDWQSQVESWSAFSGKTVDVSLSLVAGFVPQITSTPDLPEIGGGLWLDGDVQIEQGEALLWADGPLAKIKFITPIDGPQAQLEIVSLLPKMDAIQPPLIADIGRVSLPLAKLGAMMTGDKLTLEVTLNNQVRLGRFSHQYGQELYQTLASINLLRGESGLLAQIEALV